LSATESGTAGAQTAGGEIPAIRVASNPQMPAEAVAFLTERFATSACYLEYGSGGSTRLATRSKIPHIFSVESDAEFAKAVRRAVARDAKSIQFRMNVVNTGPIGRWGYPSDTSKAKGWPRYAIEIWKMIHQAGVSPDTILVDGRFRVSCCLASLINAKPGTKILFDDYVGREERYQIVETHLKPERLLGRAALFTVPQTLDLRSIAMDLALYSVNPG